MADETLINKVAASGLLTLDLEQFLPAEPVVSFDLKEHLFRGLILKEKEFREALKTINWETYRGRIVAITCTADAIIPMWAYMLVTSYLQPVANTILEGTEAEATKIIFLQNIAAFDISAYAEQRVVIKGCGDKQIDAYAYTEITRRLLPVVKSLMYGEPCSTVPVFKRK